MRIKNIFIAMMAVWVSHFYGEDIVWQSDFTKGETVNGIQFGPPLDGYDLRGTIRNKTIGKNEKVTILSKGTSSEGGFLSEKNFHLSFKNEGNAKFHYYYSRFSKPVKLEKGMMFSGYLFDGGAKGISMKLCPTVSTVSLKDGKPLRFELRSGGFSARAGMIAQHKKDWFLTSMDLYDAASRECGKMDASLEKCEIIGWAIMINQVPPKETVTVKVEDIRIVRKENIEKEFNAPNIARDKKYTFNITPNAFRKGHNGDPMCSAGNPLKKLTDGELATRCWFDSRTAGWWTDQFINITIDLEKMEPVNTVALRISSESNGMRVPSIIRIFVGDAPDQFYLAGELDKSNALKQWHEKKNSGLMDGNPHAWLVLDHLKTQGRYVTVSIQSANLYLDEIAIFSGNQGVSAAAYKNKISYSTPDITPFYKKTMGYIAREIPVPLVLMMPSWTRKYSIYLDVPPGLKLIAPKGKPYGAEKINGVDYTRYRLDQVGELYFSTTLPAGTETMIRMTGIEDGHGRDMSKIFQILPVKIISIPPAEGFQRLVCSVTFTDFSFWQRWPDAVQNYKKLGLNWFAPFGHNDYFYGFHKKKNPAMTAMIQDARDAGLKTGGNLSPFCNGQINSPLVKGRKAVYMDSGKEADVNCPRVYFHQYMKHAENHDLNSAVAAARAGLDFMLFDSEPNWHGAICRCETCREEWAKFLNRNQVPHQSMERVWKGLDSRYRQLLQSFWDEFYRDMWSVYRTKMAAASPNKKGPQLGFYGIPAAHESKPSANNPGFDILNRNHIVDFGNGTLYNVPLKDYARMIHKIRRQMPPEMPLYLWSTAGDTSMSYEQSPDSLRNQLYLLFTSGAQGTFFYSALGMDAAEYAVLAEVIRALKPYENIIADGTLMDCRGFEISPDFQISGIKSKKSEMISICNYSLKAGTAKLTLTEPFQKASLIGTEKIRQNGRTLFLDFDSGEKNAVKVLHIER